jgi:hypothetical protein
MSQSVSPLDYALLVPVFLTLWLLPWAVLIVVIDRRRKQFTVKDMLIFTALCAVEFAAGYWLGYASVLGGIVLLGVMVFVPTIVIRLVKRRRHRFLERQMEAAIGRFSATVAVENESG